MELDLLRYNAGYTSSGAKITAKGREGDDEQHHVLFAPRPVQRIVGIF
jgi:hypothetical protein